MTVLSIYFPNPHSLLSFWDNMINKKSKITDKIIYIKFTIHEWLSNVVTKIMLGCENWNSRSCKNVNIHLLSCNAMWTLLTMKAVYSSKMLVSTYKFTQNYNSEDNYHHHVRMFNSYTPITPQSCNSGKYDVLSQHYSLGMPMRPWTSFPSTLMQGSSNPGCPVLSTIINS